MKIGLRTHRSSRCPKNIECEQSIFFDSRRCGPTVKTVKSRLAPPAVPALADAVLPRKTTDTLGDDAELYALGLLNHTLVAEVPCRSLAMLFELRSFIRIFDTCP